MPTRPGDVTRLLLQWNEGKEEALDRLLPLVYRQLRGIAARSLRSERAGHTLQPTALVNEAYLKLVGAGDVRWQDRRHFFAVAAALMRRILVDHARRRAALRRGGRMEKGADAAAVAPGMRPETDVIAVDRLLTELATFDARQARLVELRFFAGLTEQETAEALGISRATTQREWRVARAWLYRRLMV
jgi:RNA polymerase sigma-70 factor, ECF subfamily